VDVKPSDIAPLTSPTKKIPVPKLPEIPELPMTLTPADPEQRAQVPKMETPRGSNRPGIDKISARKWNKDPDEISRLMGLE
jgi:hypothetical protein